PKPALQAACEAVRVAPELPSALHTLAIAELGAGQRTAALTTAERLRQAAPDWAFSHELLGLIMLRRGKWKEAELFYRHALTLNPESWISMNNLGLALQRQGRQKEAIERFHDAARLNPSAETSRKNLAQAVGRYGGVSFLGIWIAIRIVAAAGKEAGVWTVPLGIIAVVGGVWGRARRLPGVPP